MAQIQVSVAANGGAIVPIGAPVNPLTVALYVGDLDFSVTDAQLFDHFNEDGQVVTVRVCRDLTTRRSLGYGYVNFTNHESAAKAMERLNYTPLNGKPIRIMYSHRDPTIRKSGAGNIFIKNLDKSIDHKALLDTFSSFGNVLSCKVALDSFGQSKGYGFVQFDSVVSAETAINKLNGMLMNDKQVFVEPYVRKQEREAAVDKSKFNNVFVKNLSQSVTEEDMQKVFGEYGSISSVAVMKDGEGKSRCFGFVNFENAEDAAKAVDALTGKTFDGKEWFVGKAQKKSEREVELKGRYEQSRKETVDKTYGLNLYIKNLDDSIDDEKLKELFSDFGAITSNKVMRDLSGVSKGTAFVAFSQGDEAAKALAEMNGKMVGNKPLYVAFAQRKEDRRARLQFSQMRPVSMSPPYSPRMPIFHPGAPGMAQPIYFGQAPPTMIPPQPAFGYQPQLIPGLRPGGGPMSNYFMPIPQGQQGGQRPGGRRGGVVQHQSQQQLPMIPPPMFPRGRMVRFPPVRGMNEGQLPGFPGNMFAGPYDMNGTAMRGVSGQQAQPMPVSALITALANAAPDQQISMLGESLYPLVKELEPEAAGKVTGMLLEMDQTEVLHLIESPDALKSKVGEAMEVLRKSNRQQSNIPDEQLAGLSLKDNHV
uniref:Polyadenylate-binding protein n=1 Tax=Kalanchoe fedtschenkoi TaxID=63787 RepID=A0A7N0UUP2_KALFE